MLNGLEADRIRIADLEAQILDLERSLSALRNEKVLVQERLDAYKYPVLTLPNEIVSEIFIHFLPVYPLCPPLAGILSPTSLTQICRKWRDIALATPALWRALESRCCPLSIHTNEYEEWIHVPEILSTLVPHCARWEHLRLRLLSHFPDGPLPLLRHLDLTLEKYSDLTFPNMPLLRTAVLHNVANSKIGLPWSQLTSLTLRAIYPDECLSILQQTLNLVHCDVHWEADVFRSDSNGARPKITFPYLESLTLWNPNDDLVIWHLDTFIVPALRSLTTPERFLGPGSNPIESLASFMSKSGCRLQEVCITGLRTVSGRSFRQAFPSIRRFSFSGPWLYDSDSDSDSSSAENNSGS
ncbi:hypothetical protein B0H13DRAFT_2472932 [Mycena leptocephala]|nr:hypothetical protein B0H13DRAFT_2472932 [Mycena leptocephala]